MKKTLIFVILFQTLNTFGQTEDIVTYHEKVYGNFYLDNSPIRGFELRFEDRIHKSFIDTMEGLLTVELRNTNNSGTKLRYKGRIVQYDLINNGVLWTREINYKKNNFDNINGTILISSLKSIYCLDLRTGKEALELKTDLYFSDRKKNLGLGYKFPHGISNMLEGINLKNGEVLWTRKLNREFGWQDSFFLDDTTLLVSAQGLHTININTGRGWDYHTETFSRTFTSEVVSLIDSPLAHALFGYQVKESFNVVKDLYSNCLVDSLILYFASKESLAGIDRNTGEVIWKISFPESNTSRSTLIMDDSLVYMFNHGYAHLWGNPVYYGKPFIAAFDKKSGDQKYFNLISQNKTAIMDYAINGNDMYLIYEHKIEKYKAKTGELLLEKYFSEENFGALLYFGGLKTFITDGYGSMIGLREYDSTKIYVFNERNEAHVIDTELNYFRTLPADDLYHEYLTTSEYKFLSREQSSVIINREGRKLVSLKATKNSVFVRSILLNTLEKSLSVIDLSGL